ncbi:hypothetical protein QCA50_013134 [Cerrena zonata]|uniref:AAA+ ATPase domain-containing protein n=1 Tax=Cerrena zonata TaxID=2478898 RepID=A0AAW0FRT4_9APHY
MRIPVRNTLPCAGLDFPNTRLCGTREVIIYDLLGRRSIHSELSSSSPTFHSTQAEPRPYPLAFLASYISLIATNIMTRTNNTPSTSRLAQKPHPPSTFQRARTYSQSQSRRSSLHGASTTLQVSWFLKSSLPRKRGTPLPYEVQKRTFFGMGEIVGVIANPSETLRSLRDSKRMLDETRRELEESRERAQLSPTHTFSPLPGFYDRPAEIKAIQCTLRGEPSFTVLFGASSVGKTALLRQVLTSSEYHVLHFDLRIAGFADLASLYFSLSQQMESFFMGVSKDPDMPGYEEFEKEAWAFKHDRLGVERRVSAANGDGQGAAMLGEIKTSDIARIMELFQSSLLKYWTFQPSLDAKPQSREDVDSTSTKSQTQPSSRMSSRLSMFLRRHKKNEVKADKGKRAQVNGNGEAIEKPQERKPPVKKMPVFLIDEAHKLPALIRSRDTMKCILDAMLVLTKQDRLCHVIHATSDPFYQTWLRQLNVMQHCKILTVGDYPRVDTRKYFRERILPTVPERLRSGLQFEKLYDAFGGKVAHWQDFVADYVNANGHLEIHQSSHFLQAHALLNLHVIHSAQAVPAQTISEQEARSPRQSQQNGAQPNLNRVNSMGPAPVTSGSGFRIYSPLNGDLHTNPMAFSPTEPESSDSGAEYSATQLLRVMNRFIQPGTRALSYFILCREMGARAIDAMVRGKILDIRWTDTISREGYDPRVMSMRIRESMPAVQRQANSSGTVVNDADILNELSEDDDMFALTEEEIMRMSQQQWEILGAEDEEQIVGPKLVPVTPIMRYAMRKVVDEYRDDDRTVSEYESLAEVEEY